MKLKTIMIAAAMAIIGVIILGFVAPGLVFDPIAEFVGNTPLDSMIWAYGLLFGGLLVVILFILHFFER